MKRLSPILVVAYLIAGALVASAGITVYTTKLPAHAQAQR